MGQVRTVSQIPSAFQTFTIIDLSWGETGRTMLKWRNIIWLGFSRHWYATFLTFSKKVLLRSRSYLSLVIQKFNKEMALHMLLPGPMLLTGLLLLWMDYLYFWVVIAWIVLCLQNHTSKPCFLPLKLFKELFQVWDTALWKFLPRILLWSVAYPNALILTYI